MNDWSGDEYGPPRRRLFPFWLGPDELTPTPDGAGAGSRGRGLGGTQRRSIPAEARQVAERGLTGAQVRWLPELVVVGTPPPPADAPERDDAGRRPVPPVRRPASPASLRFEEADWGRAEPRRRPDAVRPWPPIDRSAALRAMAAAPRSRVRHRISPRGLTVVPAEPRRAHTSELFAWAPPEVLGPLERSGSDGFQTLLEDHRQSPAGNWLGIVLGMGRSVGELVDSFAALGDLGAALSDVVDTLMSPEWLLLGPSDLASVLPEVFNLMHVPLQRVIEDIRLAAEAQSDDDQVEYSARITQATIRVEQMLVGLGGAAVTARKIPASLRHFQSRLENLRSELRRRRVSRGRRSMTATPERTEAALAEHHYSGLPAPTHEAARAALARVRRRGLLQALPALRDPHRRLGAVLQRLIAHRGPGRQADFHELIGLAERAREARSRGRTLRVQPHPRGHRDSDAAEFEGSSSRSTPLAEATGRYEVTSVNEIRPRAATDRRGRPVYVPSRLEALEWSIFDRIDSKIGPEGQIRSLHPQGLVRAGEVDVFVSTDLGYTHDEIRDAAVRATRSFARRHPSVRRVRVLVLPDSSDTAIDTFLRTGRPPRPRTLHEWGRLRAR